uniref:Uncharacterized protein n=1 Tax=Amphiprion percula TaxID=161767 RepID=A0A3P8SXY8_AMPPE
PGIFLHGVCMFFLCTHGFSLAKTHFYSSVHPFSQSLKHLNPTSLPLKSSGSFYFAEDSRYSTSRCHPLPSLLAQCLHTLIGSAHGYLHESDQRMPGPQ